MSADQYDRSKPVMDPWCPNCHQPWPTPEQEALQKTAIEYFTAYFANNYHGAVVFHDPAWHAPRVFRAALWALQQAKKDAVSTAQETIPEQELCQEGAIDCPSYPRRKDERVR